MTTAIVVAMAAAAPADDRVGNTRVVLADADPELRRAIEATLAPWHVEVVVEVAPPADARAAREWNGHDALAPAWQMRPDAQTARFVVWRERGELVVFDRERGQAEHRAAPTGALDPVSAAAAALTVKTLMRLPPPSSEAAPPGGELAASGPVEPDGPELRVQATLATRLARGLDTEVGGRLVGAAFVRPWAWTTLRFGIAGEVGTPTDVQRTGFKGTWRDWAVLGLASWAGVHARWEIEPYVGAGATRSRLDGDEGMIAHHERATLLLVRAGVMARYRAGRFSIGGTLGADAVLDTPAYTKSSSGTKFFEVPPFALAIGVVGTVDLTR